jgi:Domain of unknown function (DUF4124)
MLRVLLIVSLALASFGVNAAGKIYKWTDKDGVVHYDAQPPPDVADAERIKLDAAPTPTAAAATTDGKTEGADKTGPLAKQFEENCGIARGNLDALTQSGPIALRNEDGSQGAELSSDQREERIKAAREQVALYCK